MERLLDALRQRGWPIAEGVAEETVEPLPTGGFRLPPSPARDALRVGRLRPNAGFPWCVLLVTCGGRRLDRWTLRGLVYPFVHEKLRSFGWFETFPLERLLLVVEDAAGLWAVHLEGEGAMGSRLAAAPLEDAPLNWDGQADWEAAWRTVPHERASRTPDRRRFPDAFYRAQSEGLADLVRFVRAQPPLDLDAHRTEFARLIEGREGVRERIFLAMAEPAIAYATRYWRRHPEIGAPLEDVVMATLAVMWERLGKADAAKGGDARYLFPWITRTVMRSIREERRPISVPAYVEERYGRDRRLLLAEEQGVAVRLEFEAASRLIRSFEFGDPWPELTDELLATFDPYPALDAALAFEETLREVASRLGPDGKRVLSERQFQVLTLRYGVDPRTGGVPMTLEAVGDALGITRERVRQIELRAVVRLKAVMEQPFRPPSTVPSEVVDPLGLLPIGLRARVEAVRSGAGRGLTLRELLAMFGFKNRSSQIVLSVREKLLDAGVRCVPEMDARGVGLDTWIKLECVP